MDNLFSVNISYCFEHFFQNNKSFFLCRIMCKKLIKSLPINILHHNARANPSNCFFPSNYIHNIVTIQ